MEIQKLWVRFRPVQLKIMNHFEWNDRWKKMLVKNWIELIHQRTFDWGDAHSYDSEFNVAESNDTIKMRIIFDVFG